MFFMAVICVWHAIEQLSGIMWIDMGSFIVLGVLYVIARVAHVAYVYYVVSQNN